MSTPAMGDRMTVTYTGCVEAVNDGGSFLLTHIAGDQRAMMHPDAMTKATADMAKQDQPGTPKAMHGDRMMPTAVVLAGRSDLKKHLGWKVTVSGALSHGRSATIANDRDMLAVASLKVVAKSCS